MPKIDEIDENIIRLLQKDGTLTNIEIAKRLETSEATIRRRRMRLESDNVIRIVGSANPLALGYGTVAIIGVQTENARIGDVERALKRLPEVHFLGLSTGIYDLMMEVWLRSNEDVVRFKTVELAKIDGILRLDIFQFVKLSKYYAWTGGLSDADVDEEAYQNNIRKPIRAKKGRP
jgi:Lrp/AsnC family transcriptional regulator for asnA, asnC and gidA